MHRMKNFIICALGSPGVNSSDPTQKRVTKTVKKYALAYGADPRSFVSCDAMAFDGLKVIIKRPT